MLTTSVTKIFVAWIMINIPLWQHNTSTLDIAAKKKKKIEVGERQSLYDLASLKDTIRVCLLVKVR